MPQEPLEATRRLKLEAQLPPLVRASSLPVNTVAALHKGGVASNALEQVCAASDRLYPHAVASASFGLAPSAHPRLAVCLAWLGLT